VLSHSGTVEVFCGDGSSLASPAFGRRIKTVAPEFQRALHHDSDVRRPGCGADSAPTALKTSRSDGSTQVRGRPHCRPPRGRGTGGRPWTAWFPADRAYPVVASAGDPFHVVSSTASCRRRATRSTSPLNEATPDPGRSIEVERTASRDRWIRLWQECNLRGVMTPEKILDSSVLHTWLLAWQLLRAATRVAVVSCYRARFPDELKQPFRLTWPRRR
jgi:hypothetical protein